MSVEPHYNEETLTAIFARQNNVPVQDLEAKAQEEMKIQANLTGEVVHASLQSGTLAHTKFQAEQEKKKRSRELLSTLTEGQAYRDAAIKGLEGEIKKRNKEREANNKKFSNLEAREARLQDINNRIENGTFNEDSPEGKAALEDAGLNDVSEIPEALKLIRDTKAALQEKNVVLEKEIAAQEKAIVELRQLKSPSVADINKVLTDNGQEKLKDGQTLGEVRRELKIENRKDKDTRKVNKEILDIDEKIVEEFMQDHALYIKGALTKGALYEKINDLDDDTKQFLTQTSPEVEVLLKQADQEMADNQSYSKHLNETTKELVRDLNAPLPLN